MRPPFFIRSGRQTACRQSALLHPATYAANVEPVPFSSADPNAVSPSPVSPTTYRMILWEHSRQGIVVRTKLSEREKANETACAYYRGYGRCFGMCNHAQDPNLSRRIGDRHGPALSASTSAAAPAAAADGELPGWVDSPSWRDLSCSAAAAAAATRAPFRRTRLIFKAGAEAPASPTAASHRSPARAALVAMLAPAP